ncbi:hypothetical protein ACFL6Y_09730 [Elusimicrobiota bacterium]
MNEIWKACIEEINSYLKIMDLKAIDGNPPPWEFLETVMKSLTFERIYLKGTVQKGCNIEGNIYLSEGSLIKYPTVIEGSGFIGKDVIIGPYAYLRGNFLIGDKVNLGRAEFKSSIMLSGSHAAHFSYVGDSVIGRKCNLGAGTKTGNLRLDGKNIPVVYNGQKIQTGRRKLGAIMEDGVKTGCNVVTNPGTYLKKGKFVLPCKNI